MPVISKYAFYRMNENSGIVVSDSSGNGKHGITISMEETDWVIGKLGTCLEFDGLNEYVNCGNIAGFERTDVFSFESWFKTNKPGRIILSKRRNTTPITGWQISFNPVGKIIFLLTSSSTTYIEVESSTGGLSDNIWHHLVITYDGSSDANGIHIYIDANDNVLNILSNTLSGSILNSVNCQISGRDGTNYCFKGLIDEVVIYDKELSQAEVTQRYNIVEIEKTKDVISSLRTVSGNVVNTELSLKKVTFNAASIGAKLTKLSYVIKDLRNETRSTYYKVVDIFSTWTSIAILNSRKDIDKSIPCIVVEYQHSLPIELEIGDADLKDINSFYILSVYADREGQLLDILDTLYKGFATTYDFIDYSVAFPSQIGYDGASQKIGTLDAYDIDVMKVYTGLESVSLVDRYRGQVSFRVKRNI